MLGQVRRTTRADVGLALAMTGISYLIWAVAVGVSRGVVNQLSLAANVQNVALPSLSRWLVNSFIHAAPVWDLVGVLWLLVSLVLVIGSSRQRWIISWPWLSAICQAMAAALLGAWAAVAGVGPFVLIGEETQQAYPATGWTSLSAALAVAMVMWVTTLVWMLSERARLRRGPSLRDTLRTHVPG